MRRVIVCLALLSIALVAQAQTVTLESEQITFGPDHHHFFGYFGHAGNMPWNESGRYIVALRTTFDDRWPEADDAADVILLDTQNDYKVEVIEQSLAWNFQQGTMLNWRVEEPETQPVEAAP